MIYSDIVNNFEQTFTVIAKAKELLGLLVKVLGVAYANQPKFKLPHSLSVPTSLGITRNTFAPVGCPLRSESIKK